MQIALLGSKSPYLFMYCKNRDFNIIRCKIEKKGHALNKVMSGKSQQFVERKGTFLARPSRCFRAKGNKFFFNTFQRLSPSNLSRGSKISFFLN